VDIAMTGGAFEAAFGPAPNDGSGNGNRKLRLRVDRFFSNIPYQRMVSALSQMSSIPESKKRPESEGIHQPGKDNSASASSSSSSSSSSSNQYANICMDEIFRETIISTFMLHDASSIFFRDTEACDLRESGQKFGKTTRYPIRPRLPIEYCPTCKRIQQWNTFPISMVHN
jgi:hypothetical protein